MSTQSLQTLLRTLFLAPGQAALEAERGYRQLWAEWLQEAQARLGLSEDPAAAPTDPPLRLLREQLPRAPVLKINGHLELGVTLRIASVAGGKAELQVGAGPIGVSGGYFRQTAEESVMSVRATFTLTNAETDLASYLAQNGVPLASADDVKNAIARLQEWGEVGNHADP